MYLIGKSLYKLLLFFIRIILILISIILFPLFYFLRFKKNKIIYYSLVSYNFIKERPQIICDYLSNNYKVTYSFVTDKTNNNYLVNDNLIVKDYIYNDNNKVINRIYLMFKSFLTNYNTVIISNPTQLKYIDIYLLKIKGIKVIYDCMDFYEYWIIKDQLKYYYYYEIILFKNAYQIIVSSNALKESILNKYPNIDFKINVVRNGYSFNKVNNKKFGLKHPNSVYIGTIDEYLDFNTLIEYANNNYKHHIYLVGPVIDKVGKYTRKLPNNIHLYGVINHDEVSSFIKESDILLIPFIVNDLIKHVDPIKIYEYLSFKKPIISSYWKELDRFKDYVLFYNKDNTFSDCVTKANNIKIDYKNVDKLLKDALWDNRIKEYLDIIK